METYFRIQNAGYTFNQTQNHVSADGGDDGGTEGICACSSVSELMRNTVFGLLDESSEVIIFKANKIAEIYDGYRVEPVSEICRFTKKEFVENSDEIAEKYEEW